MKSKLFLLPLLLSSLLLVQGTGQYQTLAATPPNNIRVAQVINAQNEPSIALNPRNASNLIASSRDFSLGYRQCRYYYSSDGGQTWGNNLIPMTGPLSPFAWCSDPSVAFDSYGNAYYAGLALLNGNKATYRSAVFVARSADGGMNYAAPVLVRNVTGVKDDVFLDKDYIAVDQKLNHVYMTWTELPFSNASAWVDFSRSLDNATSFSKQMRITDLVNNATWSTLAQSTSGPNGEVYVEWIRGFNPDNNTYELVFDRSLNGGLTFGINQNVTSFPAIPGSLNPYTFRATSIPSIDADRTNSSYEGTIYITWADERNGDADIFLIHSYTSYNQGIAWSSPVRVNDDPIHNGRDQWMPWVNVSPEGRVNVAFFDRRDDSSNTLFNLYWSSSLDGGVTFQPNVKITSAQSSPYVWAQPVNADGVGQLGDYLGMTSRMRGNSTYIYPVWTDSRDGTATDHNLNIYTATIGPPTAPLSLKATSGADDIRLNWTVPSFSNGPPITGYKIYRGTASNAESYLITINNSTIYDDHPATTGVEYYYEVSAINTLGDGARSSEALGVATGGLGLRPTLQPILLAALGTMTVLIVFVWRSNRKRKTIPALNVERGRSGTVSLKRQQPTREWFA